MSNLEETKNSLNFNSYLTNDIKENLMQLITIFNKSFPEIDLSNLNERLKTLRIVRGSKFLIKGSSYYNPIDNELLLNMVFIDNGADCKHILMRELLNIITAKDNFSGFNKDNAYEALNLGYTEILSNYLVGNEGEPEYEDEIIATNMLGIVIGKDKFYEAFFKNDASLITNEA